MLILGIETSCDDTAIALLEVKRRQATILSNVVSSQLKVHQPFGGVVPNLAAREHEKNLPLVLRQALTEARVEPAEVDLIAVTAGPGLAPALWRGVSFANALAQQADRPLVAVNHLHGHIYSNWLAPVGQSAKLPNASDFPVLNLIVSGGHTELVLMTKLGHYQKIGATLDDAAGEAFDKVARLLGLGFPGGPAISAKADEFRIRNYELGGIKLPRPMFNSKNFDFSFSGLKTAVLYLVRDLQTKRKKLSPKQIAAICHEFQQAVVEVLVKKTLDSARQYQVKTVALSGGVSANRQLRAVLQSALATTLPKTRYRQPELIYTGDNAAMIALAGYLDYQNRKPRTKIQETITADANWEIRN